MTRHTVEAEIEVRFHVYGTPDDEREIANPRVAITFDYIPGRPAWTPRGEYAPIDPPEAAEVSFVSAKLIDGDGLDPTQRQIDDWARSWLEEDGYELACNAAEDERYAAHNVR